MDVTDLAGLAVAFAALLLTSVGAAIGYDRWKMGRKERFDSAAVRNAQVDELIGLLHEDRDHESLFGTLRGIRASQDAFGVRLDRHLIAEEAATRALQQEIHELRARVEELG